MSRTPAQAPARPLARLRAIQTTALVLLVAAGLLNYMDRSALAIANPLIRKDLGVSIAGMGLLLSTFLWAYALAQLPVGFLLDRVGPRRVLGLGLALWSLAQGAAGLVGGMGQFLFARAALGVGEAPMFPSASAATRDWYPAPKRALPTGIWNCVSTLGPAIAPPILTLVMLELGWRGMFMALGVVGVGLAGLWFVVYRDRTERTLTPDEAEELAEPDAGLRFDIRLWGQLFRYRMTWGLVAGYFGVIYILWLFSGWLPGYLEIQRHLDIKAAGLLAGLPFAFGVVGSIASGGLADQLVRRGFSPIQSRKLIVTVSLLGMAVFTGLAALAGSVELALAEIAGALFFNGCATAMAWAMVGVAAPRQCVGSLGGIQNFGGYLGGAAAPYVTGRIVQSSGSFTAALLLGAGLALASAIIYALVVPKDPISLSPRATP